MHDIKIAGPHLHTLGERLRYRRRQMGWTQEHLATQAGTNQAVIQKIENGKSIRPRKIDDIANVLAINPAWLMFGAEQASPLSNEAHKLAEMWVQLADTDRQRIYEEIVGLIDAG